MARTYRALAALLSYPTEALQAATHELARSACSRKTSFPAGQRAAINALLEEIARSDIYELQERLLRAV